VTTTYDILVLDALNHAHRCWWRCRDSLTGDGRDNGLERGFLEGLVYLERDYPTAQVVLAWDGEPVGQRSELPEYKAARAERHKNRPVDWHPRCDALRDALAHQYATLYDPADEADYEIARLVNRIADGKRTLIVSTDSDLLMLLAPRVHLLRPGVAREFYGLQEFQLEYGFAPANLALYKALVGDKSDGIPGLPYFPKAVAKQLVAAFGSVGTLYSILKGPARSPKLGRLTQSQRQKLLEGEDRVRSNARLVDLHSVSGAPHLRHPSGDWAPLWDLLRDRDLDHLAAGLEWDALTGNGTERKPIDLTLDGDDVGNAADCDEQASPAPDNRPLCDPAPFEETPAGGPSTTPGDVDSGPASVALAHPLDRSEREARNPVGDGWANLHRSETGRNLLTNRQPTTEHDMHLLPAWSARLEDSKQNRGGMAEPIRIIPRAPDYYAERLTFVEDRVGAEAMFDFARQRRIGFIGIDCEFRYSRPGVLIRRGRRGDLYWYDPTSIVPLLVAVVLAETRPDGQAVLYRFVVDSRRHEVLSPLADLIRQPIPVIGHFIQAELFCLWKLDLPTPATVWDTCTAERAFQLGVHHVRYKKEKFDGEEESARLTEETEEDVDFSCGLVATCLRRGVPYAFAAAKDRLQRSFLDHADDQPFSSEQQDYVAADAEAAAKLYPIQVQLAITENAHRHLFEVEMPWAITNAAMIWAGVRIEPMQLERLAQACRRHDVTLTEQLAELGVGNVNSHPDMFEYFRTIGLLEAFRDGRSYTFDDDHLKAVEGRHDAIPLIRLHRKIKRLRSDKLLTGELMGSDGRLHPDHRQLGAESGRNTMRNPNIGGIGKALRPLVVPEDSTGLVADGGHDTPGDPGEGAAVEWGIGEVDLSQIEVLIAAAESRDPELIAMVNGRDVYCAMVREFYADRLSPESLALPDEDFSEQFRGERDIMKIFTLAIIYNITPLGLSRQLGISVQRAANEQAKFLALFPVLDRALREVSAYGAIRGYAQLRTGLRRHRARRGRPTPWEVNWLRNTPIQGSASVVFKVAGNRLRLRYEHYGARLILPLHDDYVFEAPLVHLKTIGRITAEVMTSTVQEFYPVLDPRVDVNIDYPHCWNKNGKYRSLELWIQDPELARKYLKSKPDTH
jgi:DNA polymerase-1